MTVQWERRLVALAGEAPRLYRFEAASRGIGDPRLAAAYGLCDRITSGHSKSFYLASALLPPPKRRAIRAMYAFCRTVDDLVDAPSAVDPGHRLEYWRKLSLGLVTPSDDSVAMAWTDTIQRYRIPRRYASQLIDGVARDLHARNYETFDELTTYCYGVASTVGLMSMYVVGFESPEAVQYAVKLGVALQMTNILRDVGEDLRNGRLYLPAEELRAFGVSDEDLRLGLLTANWTEFMRFQIQRARRLYEESRPGIRLLHGDGRLAIAAAADLYEAILGAIERNGFDVFARRASLGAAEKLRRVPRLFVRQQLNWLRD
jgi:phytoene synthase